MPITHSVGCVKTVVSSHLAGPVWVAKVDVGGGVVEVAVVVVVVDVDVDVERLVVVVVDELGPRLGTVCSCLFSDAATTAAPSVTRYVTFIIHNGFARYDTQAAERYCVAGDLLCC